MKGSTYSLRRLTVVCFLLAAVCGFGWSITALADDDDDHKHHHGSKYSWFFRDSSDQGNEFTGQCAAWVFAAANIPVIVSILLKTLVRHTPLSRDSKLRIKQLNQFQKRHLMRVHYLLNPVALVLALIHFSLSSCRSSSLPEWGLGVMAILVAIGMMMKLHLSPRNLRRRLHRLHTSPITAALLVAILIVGHSIVD